MAFRKRKNSSLGDSYNTKYGFTLKKDPGIFILSRVVIIIAVIVIVFPILYIFSLSLRTKATVYQDILFLIPKAVTLQNYTDAWSYAATNLNVTFLEMFRNSIIASFSAIFIALFTPKQKPSDLARLIFISTLL